MMTAEAVYKQVKGEHMLVSFRWEQRQLGTNWVLMNTCQTAGNTSQPQAPHSDVSSVGSIRLHTVLIVTYSSTVESRSRA